MRVEHKLRFRIYKGRTFDAGIDFALSNRNAAFEDATDNTFLFPDLAFVEFPVGIKTGKLGAGAGAAGRAVIGFTGTEYKILAVDRRRIGWPKQFNVIDLLLAGASNSAPVERLANCPGEVRQLLNIFERQFKTVLADKEKPVSSPGNVAAYSTITRNIHFDI